MTLVPGSGGGNEWTDGTTAAVTHSSTTRRKQSTTQSDWDEPGTVGTTRPPRQRATGSSTRRTTLSFTENSDWTTTTMRPTHAPRTTKKHTETPPDFGPAAAGPQKPPVRVEMIERN